MTTTLSKLTRLFVPLVFLTTTSFLAQGTIQINQNIERSVNNEVSLKRTKYFNIHQLTDLNDQDFKDFKSTYGIPSSYRGGRLLDSPMRNVKSDGTFPTVQRNHSGVRPVEDRFASGAPNHFFYDKDADYSQVDMTNYINRLTNYMRDYYRYQEAQVPRYIEPLNEPMIHANEYYPESPQYISSKIETIITRICEMHRELGKKIHGAPELANMKVVGYASAFPMFENNDFDLWNKRYKKFIDIAGKEMDLFSIHLYDGKGVNNDGGRRSGSNVEAILDMVETYSKLKLNKVKPIAITEYGRLVPNQSGWAQGNGVSNYEAVENSQAVRSQMHMVMSIMERGGDVEYSIPFTMAKTPPTAQYSKSGLWNRVSTNPAVWEYTPRVRFFDIWKGVKGKRVLINSSNIDVQTQAFVDGNKLYVVLNNLNDNAQTVSLDLPNRGNIENVGIKRLKVFLDKLPSLTNTTVNTAPNSIKLAYGETAVLTYNFKSNITFDNKITSKKYYADKYLQAISANQNITFNFENVLAEEGQATLRLSIGRDLAANRKPEILINGKKVNYSGDVIRGYDQNNRARFFGTLEIPVDFSLIKGITNPKVQVKFPDAGGHVSSAVLQVQNLDKTTVVTNPALPTGQFYIVNRETGKKIRSVEKTNDGKPLELVPANWNGSPTKWTVVDTGDGYFHIKNVDTEMYFRPFDDGNVNGSVLVQRPTGYSGSYTRWKQIPTTDGYFFLQNKQTQMYFRPETDADFSNIIQRPTGYNGTWTQWKFVPVTAAKELGSSISETMVKMYPNPVSQGSNVTIEAPNNDNEIAVEVYNLQGALVNASVSSSNTIELNTSALSPGVYLVSIQVGEISKVEKLIVK